MRNVAVKIRKVNHTHCLGKAKLIFGAYNKKEAIKRFTAWEKKWVVEEERAARCMREDFLSNLHYHNADRTLQRSVRTTNILERAFRGAPEDPPHEQLLHQRGERRSHHVRRDRYVKPELERKHPETNFDYLIDMTYSPI